MLKTNCTTYLNKYVKSIFWVNIKYESNKELEYICVESAR